MAGCKESKSPEADPENKYTCNEYRTEMILLSLQRRLGRDDLSDSERRAIQTEIEQLKVDMGMA